MTTKLRVVWEKVHSSYAFVPSLMAAATVALALLTLSTGVPQWLKGWSALYGGSAAGAREVLSAIASSMITVAGVVFSVTIVVLALASSQFGPEVLRHFMRDTRNHFVFGMFVSTFLYCLIVLRTIREEGAGSYVPSLAVSIAVVLAVASVAVLIFFIHHIISSLQASEVAARIGADLNQAIRETFPREPAAKGEQQITLPEGFEQHAFRLRAPRDAYVQGIAHDELLRLAVQHDLILLVQQRPGKFVIKETTMARAWPADSVKKDIAARLLASFALGHMRTQAQDVEFAIGQLTQMAARALSPSLNDPHTAKICVDRLSAAVALVAQRATPPHVLRDEQGRPRVIIRPSDFAGVLDAAFNEIREYGAGHPAVVISVLESFSAVAECVRSPGQRQAVLRQAELLYSDARRKIKNESDLNDVAERYEELRRNLSPESAREAA